MIFRIENDENNPIKGAFMGNDGKRPEYVIAVVQPQNLRTGLTRQYTPADNQLAAEIRTRGMHGDQCGHVISYNLGGQVEYKNLFPQGKVSNITQYHRVEKAIGKFVGSTNKKNPWALILVRLFYNNLNYPNRPTKVCYSFFLYEDKEVGNGAENVSESRLLMPILPIGVKISVEGCVYVESKQRVAPNRVAAKSNAESRQFWENCAIGLQTAASVVSLLSIAQPPEPIPNKGATGVPTPVPVVMPGPVPPVVKPDVPISSIWSQQLLLNRMKLSQPLVVASC